MDDDMVFKNNKKLYHIQIEESSYSNAPLDFFIFCSGIPTKENIKKVITEYLGDEDSVDDWLDELTDAAEFYAVWATELD